MAVQGAKSKLDLSTSSAVCWILIGALQESFRFISWILQSIKQYISHSDQTETFYSSLEDLPFHSVIQGCIMQAYYIIFVNFSSWGYTFWPICNFWNNSPTSLHIHQPRLHSAKLRADRKYEQKSDGQVLRAVVQYLIWPHIYCSVLQFTVHSVNSKGKLWREMWWKLHSVLVATKSSLPNTLKGNCNIWRVI